MEQRNHSSMKKKPSKEGLLPNGCMVNPLSINEPRSIISVDGRIPHASLLKR